MDEAQSIRVQPAEEERQFQHKPDRSQKMTLASLHVHNHVTDCRQQNQQKQHKTCSF